MRISVIGMETLHVLFLYESQFSKITAYIVFRTYTDYLITKELYNSILQKQALKWLFSI